MTPIIPRVRLFGGPNGSGKSTIKSMISPNLLGISIDPDQIEKEMRESGSLNFQPFKIHPTRTEFFDFFSRSHY